MRSARALPTLLVVSLFIAPPARAAWHELEEIPVESPVYHWVEDLASSYPLSRGLLLTRPWTRADVGRFLDQLVADTPAAARDPVVARLRRELEPGGGIDGLEPAFSADLDETSLEISPYVRLGYAEDQARDVVLRDDRVGFQGSLAFAEHGLLFADAYAGTVTPGAHGTPNTDGSFTSNSSDLTAWFDRAYATWATPGFSVRAGHTWLRWGVGATATLALSDAAPAVDLIESRVGLGKGAQFAWFVAALDPVAGTYLAGHRLELRAGPSVELSFGELARFSGSGNAPLFLVPVIPYALMERRMKSSTSGPDSLAADRAVNVLYTADFTWTWRPGIRLYGEVMMDDATLDGSRPLAMGWQGGGELRRRGVFGVWTGRIDYSRVYPNTYAAASGLDFVHAGFPIGFPLGPDVDQWSARIELRTSPDWTWGAEGSIARKGPGRLGDPWQPGAPIPPRTLGFPVEHDQRAALTADWSPSPSWTVSAVAGTVTVDNLGHVIGHDTNGAFGSARATLRW